MNRTNAWAAIRNDYDGKEFIDFTTLAPTPSGSVEHALIPSEFLAGRKWNDMHPVVRYAEVTIYWE